MYEEEIEIMQHNLVHIRKSLYMTAKDLGSLIGVTRQTINNIEAGRNRLTQTQYLALLYVLQIQIFPRLHVEDLKRIGKLLKCKVIESNYIDSLKIQD